MKLKDTVRSFKEIVEGKHDDLPEQGVLHGRGDRRSHREGGETETIMAEPRKTVSAKVNVTAGTPES